MIKEPNNFNASGREYLAPEVGSVPVEISDRILDMSIENTWEEDLF